MDFLPYFDEQIEIQRRAISAFKIWVLVLVVTGILIVVLSVVLGNIYPSASSDLIKVGGGFVAILGVFPGKEIYPRRETIAKYDCLRQNFSNFDHLSADDQKFLTGLAGQMFK